MKKLLFVLVVMLLVLSCGSKTADSNGGKGEKVFTLNAGSEPPSIDPQLSTDTVGGTVNDLISEGLLKRDTNGNIVGGLAEKWEVSEDNLVWTFHLREGIKWSNGDPVTAHDFKAGWVRALDPASASGYAYMLYSLKNAENFNTGKAKAEDLGIEVLDDKTIRVTLESVTPYFDDLVTFKTYLPLNEKFYETVGEKYATEAENILATGPYKIEKWIHDAEMVLVKNDQYYDKENVKVDKIVLKFISDSAASLNAFKNGEVDVTAITSEQSKDFVGDPRLISTNNGAAWYLTLNTKNPAMKNSKIRKALVMGLNRVELNDVVLGGVGQAAKTFTPIGLGMKGIEKDDFVTEVKTEIPGFNPEEAKRLLAEGLKEEGLTKFPKVEMIITEGGNSKLIGEYIQESYKNNLGIELELSAMTFQELVSRLHQKNFDISINGWKGDFKDPITYLDLFVTNGGNNHGSYSNPRYDELVKITKSTGDHVTRMKAMLEMEEIIANDTPVVSLFHRESKYLVNPRVKGLKFTPIGGEYSFINLDIQD